MQKLFGGGSVKIDPTYVGTIGSSSARITVQQNISRNVQVTYATNVNATAQQLIQAQVDITPERFRALPYATNRASSAWC